jgi:hypothetical protein
VATGQNLTVAPKTAAPGGFFGVFREGEILESSLPVAGHDPCRRSCQLKDEHRVFPGDGILPLADILRDLLAIGYAGCISLELYNPEYWKRDLEGVAREGREKTLKVITQATASDPQK